MSTMEVVIILFRLPQGSSNARHQEFRRRLYGRDTSTWSGKYRYRLSGLLDEVPHVRFVSGALMVRREHLPLVEELLQEFSAEYVWREVRPWEEDLRVLSVSPE
jgi:hypothetical protein